MATSIPSAAAAPRPMSSAAQLLAVFFSPGRVMDELAREPHFILCWVVQIAAAIGYFELLLHKLGADVLAREAIMQNPRMQNMDPNIVQNAITSTSKIMQLQPILAPVAAIAFSLVLALIFWGVANLVLGLEARYKQLIAITSYAYLTQTLLAVVSALVLILMGNPGSFSFINPIGSNLAFFMDKATTAPFVYQMSLRLDLFAIWTVVLVAIGLAKLGGKKGRFGTAFAAIFGLYLFYALCAAGLTAAFSS